MQRTVIGKLPAAVMAVAGRALRTHVHGLTEREQDVARLVLQGHSTTEIASELVVSAHTVQQLAPA